MPDLTEPDNASTLPDHKDSQTVAIPVLPVEPEHATTSAVDPPLPVSFAVLTPAPVSASVFPAPHSETTPSIASADGIPPDEVSESQNLGSIDWSFLDHLDAPLAPEPSAVETSQEKVTPSYVLHRTESSVPSLASTDLANDPRLFFSGAPSSLQNDYVGCLLQRTNAEAKRLGAPSRKVSWIPQGFLCVTRCEELTFEDGRHYSLKTTFVRDPEYTLKATKETQTLSSSTSEQPLRADASTQVSTIQTFTLGE
jgi:hypothetical protein